LQVKVRLFATLRENREKEMTLALSENSTPRDIIKCLDINEKDVAIILVNGKSAKLDFILTNEDIVSIFPPVGGG